MEYTPQESNYPVLFLPLSRSARNTTLVTIAGMVVALATSLVYSRFSNDVSPDSVAGYSYAIIGSALMLLAALRYSYYRRSHKRGVGQLNGSLNWHICFGILGLFILFLHAFDNFNPRTGTYALYGMIALVLSGILGKLIDRIMPRMIAAQVGKALTAQGEDRIESITQQLQEIMNHNSQEIHSFPTRGTSIAGIPFLSPSGSRRGTSASKERGKQNSAIQSSWDLAYFSLDETPQELNQQSAQYRFVPDRRSELSRSATYLPGTEEQLFALQKVEQALQIEQCYRYTIRYWRIFHVFLALTTIGLTIWHLVYAAQLLIPTLIH